METPDSVLSFWFPLGHDIDSLAYQQQVGWWFMGGPEVDKQIADQFSETLVQAKHGELESWAETPRGRLALIIVLDQFSRNLYRGTPEAYAQDSKAQSLVVSGLEAGIEATYSLAERYFFLLPTGHSEDLTLHDRGLPHVEKMVEQAPEHLRQIHEIFVFQTRAHRDIISRFGRHPQRNEVLGRTSTPEETDYLMKSLPSHLRTVTKQVNA